MSSEREKYVIKKVRPFIELGVKKYSRHQEKGFTNYRKFFSLNYKYLESSNEEYQDLGDEIRDPTILRSKLKSMSQKRLIEEIRAREEDLSADVLSNAEVYSVSKLKDIVYKHSTAPQK